MAYSPSKIKMFESQHVVLKLLNFNHSKLLINPAFHELDILDGVPVVCVCHMDVAIRSLEHCRIAVLHMSTVTWFGLNVLSTTTH